MSKRKVHKWTTKRVVWYWGVYHLTACNVDCNFVDFTREYKKVTCKLCIKKMGDQK